MDVMFSQDPSAYHIENGPQAAEGGTWEIKSTHSRPEKEQTHIKTLVLTISHFLCLMKHVYIHYLIWFSWLHMHLHNMLLWLSCSWEICAIKRLRILLNNRQLLHESPKNQFQNQGQNWEFWSLHYSLPIPETKTRFLKCSVSGEMLFKKVNGEGYVRKSQTLVEFFFPFFKIK